MFSYQVEIVRHNHHELHSNEAILDENIQ
jgi:hypothetical protein